MQFSVTVDEEKASIRAERQHGGSVVLNMREGTDQIRSVQIYNTDGLYEIRYDTTAKTFLNGQEYNAVPSMKLLIHEIDQGISYYGVQLGDMGGIPDYAASKRFTFEDHIFGISGIPYIIANRDQNQQWVNVRPYDHLAMIIFTLDYMPFTLHPDIPAIVSFLDLWYEGMKAIIMHGITNPYIERMFDHLHVEGNTIIWKNHKSVTRRYGLYTFINYITNGNVFAMSCIIYRVRYVYWMSRGKGIIRPDFNTILVLGIRPIRLPLYLGNGEYILQRLSNQGCEYNAVVATSGINCTNTYTVEEPFWDLGRFMRLEDTTK